MRTVLSNTVMQAVMSKSMGGRLGLSKLCWSFANYPKHEVLTMPALSPTMTEGKILKWLKKEGEKIEPGDIIFEVETDKATMGYEVQEKGFIARALQSSETISLGTPVAIITKKLEDLKSFESYQFGSQPTPTPEPSQNAPSPYTAPPAETTQPKQSTQPVINQDATGRVFASPLARSLAGEKGIDLSKVQGSGPNGRVIKQDIDSYQAVQQQPKITEPLLKEQPKKVASTSSSASGVPNNPFEEVALSSMRKTIAKRLTESKQTVPHYYVSASVEMDAVNKMRVQLNEQEKQHGVKISVNDIIIKAVALALRDYPDVNAQWNGNTIRKFKYADVSVAVAVDGGLITPIVFRADTLGLLQIAKRTKEVAKKAREGKLDPSDYTGGTSTVSNLGMFGVDSVTSIINSPQATILGVGKTEKKVLFDECAADKAHPYRVAEVMELIVSADHRAVDGALAGLWLMRVKKYLEHPSHMLL